MKLLYTKIISLVLGAFLFPLLVFANGAFANAPAGSCREAVENLDHAEDISPNLRNIKAIQKDLNSGNQMVSRETLEEIVKEILFNPELSPIELAKTLEDILKTKRYQNSEVEYPIDVVEDVVKTQSYPDQSFYTVIVNIINENIDRFNKDGSFNLPDQMNIRYSQHRWYNIPFLPRTIPRGLPWRLPLIEAIDAENPRLVAILKSIGSDVYMPSRYNPASLNIAFANTSRNLNDYRIKYPIPLALERFSAKVFSSKKTEQIVELLLEYSDPDFRYNYNQMETVLFDFFKGKTGIDKEIIYGLRDGASDLMLVARFGTAKMFSTLLEAGHDPNAKDKQGWGVENYADFNTPQERQKILSVLKEYREKHENLNDIYVGQPQKARKLPLAEAIYSRDPRRVAQLIKLGANVYTLSPYDKTTVDRMNGIEPSNGANVKKFRLRYPLHLSLLKFSFSTEPVDRAKAEQVVEVLLKHLNPTARYSRHINEEKLNALLYLENGELDDKKIVTFGVYAGTTDLMLVARYGTAKMLSYLIQRGHDITAKDSEGLTAQDYAMSNPQKEEILALLKRYKDQIKPNDLNRIHRGPDRQASLLPLTAAIDQSHFELVNYFLQSGANLYSPSPYNRWTLNVMNNISETSVREELVLLPFRNLDETWTPVENLALKALNMLSRVEGLLHTPNSFIIKYPIPLALEIFYNTDDHGDKDRALGILMLLLEKSDPKFRYNHEQLEKALIKWKEQLGGDRTALLDLEGKQKQVSQAILNANRTAIFGVSDGASDLMLVARYGHPGLLRNLLQKGHDVYAKDKQGLGVEDYAKSNINNTEELLFTLREYKAQIRVNRVIQSQIGL